MQFKIASFLSLCLLPFVCSASQIISDPSMSSTSPAVAINATNQALASWIAYNGTNSRIQVAMYDGNSWGFPTTLSASNLIAGAPVISYNSQGKGVAIWQSTDVAQKTTAIQTVFYNSSWSSITTLSNLSNSAQNPQVILNSNGEALAIWMEGFASSSTYNQLFSSQYSGGSWSSPTNIALNWEGIRSARIGFNSAGKGIAVWAATTGGLSQIFTSFYSDGSWTLPQVISSFGVHSFAPDLCWNENNQAVITWQGYINSHVQIQAINYNGTSWGSAQTLSDQPYDALAPRCTLNSLGDAIVIWSSYTGTEYGVFVATQASGSSWSSPRNFSATGYDYLEPVASLNDNNQAIIVWTSNPWNSDTKVIQSTVFSGGGWTSPIPLSDHAGTAQAPRVSLNNTGSAVIVWDRLNGGTDLIEASFETLP